MNLSYLNVKTRTKLRFVCKMMWELLQITILQINSKIVGTHTFRKFFRPPNSS
ncbi:hypothetical protein LIL_11152 [Leptospira interrogans serovar Linhai str. 56609]|nr:hypothetical protein LIL_11152 [Leptospira interrogans serovar Linhai str. 56609]